MSTILESQSSVRPAANSVSLEDLRLNIGDGLQLQMATAERTRYGTRLVGWVTPAAVIVLTPMEEGCPVPMVEGRPFIVRGFSGKDAFAFQTKVLKVQSFPCSMLFLDYPKRVEHVGVRAAERIFVRIIGTMGLDENPAFQPVPVVIDDLSLTGAGVKSKHEFAQRGSRVTLSFKVSVAGIERYIKAAGIVRSVREPDPAAQHTGEPSFVVHYGIQFGELEPIDRVALDNLILRGLIEH